MKHIKEIEYNFFASGYGKNLCDSHIGTSKQHARRTAIEKQINAVDELATVLQTLKRTKANKLITIDRSKEHNCVASDVGIKRYHHFTFDILGSTYSCKELSTSQVTIKEFFAELSDLEEEADTREFTNSFISMDKFTASQIVGQISTEDNELPKLKEQYKSSPGVSLDEKEEAVEKRKQLYKRVTEYLIQKKVQKKGKDVKSIEIAGFRKRKLLEGYTCVKMSLLQLEECKDKTKLAA